MRRTLFLDLLGRLRPGGRLLAERKAVLAEQRLREAIDALPEGIVFLDPEGRYILWNKRYAEFYHGTADLFRVGARLEDTLRVGVARGHYPDAIGREEAWLSERLAKLGQPGERHEQRLADGRWILIEERRTSDGGAVGIRVDITDLKLAEQEAREARERAEAANRAKSAFLANMSHEVRTPLNGVLGLAQVLMRTELDAHQRDLLRSILSSAATLDRVLSDVLDLSRAESGRMEVRAEPFNLGELVRELGGFFASQAHDKGLAFTVDLGADTESWVVGDRDRLKQVFSNLLDNALKFTPEGEVRFRVSRRAAGSAWIYRFEVSDTGIGFDPSQAARLFGRFEQADSSITRAHGGSGLGLAICRELVELMGGAISAAGAPGEGSVFIVEAPLPDAEPGASPLPAGAAPPPQRLDLARRPHLLVAEDNPTNRKVVELALGALGEFRIDEVENGLEAVELAGMKPYDLILMDIHMPVLDGLSATRAIRHHEATTGVRRTPIVVLSADVMVDNVAASLDAGADIHLAKPFNLAELLSAVTALLSAGGETRAA